MTPFPGDPRRAPFVIDSATHVRPTPVLVHVPHASTHLPPEVRAGIHLDDPGLARELLRLTDHDTDALAGDVTTTGATRFVNRCSRLVVDPERFPDDREELAARGMGAVYTHGSDRQPIRRVSAEEHAELLARYLTPYASAFAATVDRLLAAHGVCTIVDLHSYPSIRLPYELHDGPRPPLCVGTDPYHTPRWLRDRVVDLATEHGIEVACDSPFAGTYVPEDRFRSDRRVTSVMLEIRRDLYLDERTAIPHGGAAALTRFVTAVTRAVAPGAGDHVVSR